MKVYRPYIILLVIFAVFLTMFFINRQTQILRTADTFDMNEGWTYQGDAITVPTDLDVDKNEAYTISTTLNNDFEEVQYMLIRTSLQDITVTLDGNVIYERVYGDSLTSPYASMWNLVLIPKGSEGLTLDITFSSPYRGMSGQISDMYYGAEAALYGHLVRTYGIRLLIAAFIFMIGLIVMITDLIAFKDQQRGYVYAGLFAVLLSFWMFAESRMIQFLTGSPLLIGSLAYLALPLFPLPLITFLNKYVLKHYTKPLKYMKAIFLIDFGAVVLLYLFGIADFFQTVIASQVCLGAGIVMSLTLLILETHQHKNENAMKFIKAFGVIVICAIIELIGFALGDYQNTSLYISFGVAFIMILTLVNYIRYIVQRIKISHEKELYERLAFMDHVTQGKNRLAFERDLDGIFTHREKTDQLRLVLFDLDDLKGINDAHGHIEGDKAIKKAFDIITETFNDNGECYRIGGDEFACLYMTTDEIVFEQKKTLINERVYAFESTAPYHFGLSYGSSLVGQLDMKSIDLIHLADLDMYRHKKKRKV